MTEKHTKKSRSATKRSYKVSKDSGKSASYFVTRTEDGKILDRTRDLIPAPTNLFFGKGKKKTAA